MFKEEKRLKLESGNTCPKCEGKGYSIFYYDRMDPRGPTTSELVDDGKKFDCKFCRGKGVINLEDIRERFRHDERRETEVKRIKEAMTKFDNWTSLIYVFGQDTVDELQDELKEEGKI